MTKIEAYKGLTNANVDWTRLDKKTIRVYMSSNGNGSHHENLDRVKSYLERAGFFEFNRDFDVVCGKGYSDFKGGL
jgi:hypothetical protein